jgi:hypothetical protein
MLTHSVISLAHTRHHSLCTRKEGGLERAPSYKYGSGCWAADWEGTGATGFMRLYSVLTYLYEGLYCPVKRCGFLVLEFVVELLDGLR